MPLTFPVWERLYCAWGYRGASHAPQWAPLDLLPGRAFGLAEASQRDDGVHVPLAVDAAGTPSLEVLDVQGRVSTRLPRTSPDAVAAPPPPATSSARLSGVR